MKLKVDDPVTIKNFSKHLNGESGTVDSIDGSYILVRVFEETEKEHLIKLLDNEVELIIESTYN